MSYEFNFTVLAAAANWAQRCESEKRIEEIKKQIRIYQEKANKDEKQTGDKALDSN